MNNFKNVEILMTKPSRYANPQYAAAFSNLLTVFNFYDIRENTCHCKIINALYNVNKRDYTLLGISNKMKISDNALRRYRHLYIEWFCYFLNLSRSNFPLLK